jgi:hypothetical protein
MALITNYEKVEAGRLLKEWRATINSDVTHIELLLNKMAKLSADFPEDKAEIDAVTAESKSKLSALSAKA